MSWVWFDLQVIPSYIEIKIYSHFDGVQEGLEMYILDFSQDLETTSTKTVWNSSKYFNYKEQIIPFLELGAGNAPKLFVSLVCMASNNEKQWQAVRPLIFSTYISDVLRWKDRGAYSIYNVQPNCSWSPSGLLTLLVLLRLWK